MAFWTNYDPTVSNTGIGDKSVTPNEFGYVLTGSYELGDALQAVSDLLITGSTNFSYSGSSITPGSTNDNQWLAVSYASGAVGQDYIFVVNSADADGNGAGVFRETIGSSTNTTIGVGARDLINNSLANPEYWTEVHDQNTISLGFFQRIDNSSAAIRWANTSAALDQQSMRVYCWSDQDWVAFVIYYTNIGIFKYNIQLFRTQEPSDGHYTRIDHGAVHGVIQVQTTSTYLVGLGGILGDEANYQVVGMTTGRPPSSPPIQASDGREFIMQAIVQSRLGQGVYLGVIPGVYYTRPYANISMFDTTTINGKEYIAFSVGGSYIHWVQNEA